MRVGVTQWLNAAGYVDVTEEDWAGFSDDMAVAMEGAPRSDYVLHTMAIVKIIHDRDAAAGRKFSEQALEISPNYMLGLMSLSWAHMLGGDFDKGIEVLKQVTKQIEDDPFVSKLLFQLAAAQYHQGDFTAAVETMDRILTMKPRNPPYHRFRALCFEAMGDEAGAARARETAKSSRAETLEHCVLPPIPQFNEILDKIGTVRSGGGPTHAEPTVVDLSPREAG